MWPSQFNPQENKIYKITHSKALASLQLALDEELQDIKGEVMNGSFYFDASVFEKLLRGLGYSEDMPKLGLTLLGNSHDESADPDRLGFCFIRLGEYEENGKSSTKDTEVFMVVDLNYQEVDNEDWDGYFTLVLNRLNLEAIVVLLDLLSTINPDAKWVHETGYRDWQDEEIDDIVFFSAQNRALGYALKLTDGKPFVWFNDN